MRHILGVDFGKSYVKLALLSVSDAGETVEIKKLPEIEVTKVPRDTADRLAGWLVEKSNQAPDKQPEQIAVTVPLPLQGDVYDSGPLRKGWEAFTGKTPDAVERLLSDEVQKCLGRVMPVRIMHDAESQICFVSKQYQPQGFYAVAAFGTSIAFSIAHGRGDEFEIGEPSSTFSHAVLDQDKENDPICGSCHRTCIGAAYKTERERTDASVGTNQPKIEVKAVCHAVSVLCTLPLKTLYVTGGYLRYLEVRTAIMQMKMKYRSANIELIPVESAQFSGAIGAAYLLARKAKP